MAAGTSFRVLHPGVCVLLAGLLSCSPAGRGGWSQERRSQELRDVAALLDRPAAPVAAAQPGAPATLDFAQALDLAERRNRRIAAAASSLDAAAASVRIAR